VREERTEPNVPVGATVDGVYRPIGTASAALSYADSELANGGSSGFKFPLLLDALSRQVRDPEDRPGQARPGQARPFCQWQLQVCDEIFVVMKPASGGHK
jgi:hypothetical protein